jgi:hypothetical protein
MEPKDSLSSSQELFTVPYPEVDKYSPYGPYQHILFL